LGNKVLVAGFGCWGDEAGTGRARGAIGEGGTAASRRNAALRSRSCRSSAAFRWSGDAAGSFSRSSARTMPFSFAHARTAAAVSLYSNRTRTNPFQVRNWSIDRSHCLPCRSPQKTCPRGPRLPHVLLSSGNDAVPDCGHLRPKPQEDTIIPVGSDADSVVR
jgi:hypothetical protein